MPLDINWTSLKYNNNKKAMEVIVNKRPWTIRIELLEEFFEIELLFLKGSKGRPGEKLMYQDFRGMMRKIMACDSVSIQQFEHCGIVAFQPELCYFPYETFEILIDQGIEQEKEHKILVKRVKDIESGKSRTYSLEEVREMFGLSKS